MTDSAFNSAKEILAHTHLAQPCTLNSSNNESIPASGMFIPCQINSNAALPLIKAAIQRVHREASLVAMLNPAGVVLSFPPQYSALPTQQIMLNIRQLERDVSRCIHQQSDGSYHITREASISPLDLCALVEALATDYYQRENHRFRSEGKDWRAIPKFDATTHFVLPKGEVFTDESGLRHRKLNSRQALDYAIQCKEQGKTAYEPGALLDHVTLGPVAAHEVFSRLGLLPPGERRFEIN
jgi:hypothetical protein